MPHDLVVGPGGDIREVFRPKRPAAKTSRPDQKCAHCGDVRPPKGPVVEKSYCMKPDCQTAKRHAQKPNQPAIPCYRCKAPTAPGGPKAERRYCSALECRRAAEYWRRHKNDPDPDSTRMEDRPCSNMQCRLPMPRRPWREGEDLEIGRWCGRAACQREKTQEVRKYASDYRYWYEELKPIECDVCGLKKGVRKGFAHLDFIHNRWCTAWGEHMPDGYIAVFVKPEWAEEKKRLLG